MRNILEEAFEHLLNGDEEKAQKLIHEFMVSKACQIHESLRSEDDVLDEEYFVEYDEPTVGEDATEEHGHDDVTVDDAETTLSNDLGDEGEEHGEEKTDTDLADIEDQLERIVDELEAFLNAQGDDEGAKDEGSEDQAEDIHDDFKTDEGEEGSVKETPSDDEFDDVTESVLDELQKISLDIEDGKLVGNGGKVEGGKKPSVIPGSVIRDKSKPEPIVSGKGATHKGFDRETPAAKVADVTVNRKATAGGVDTRKRKDGKTSPVVPPKGTLLSTKP